MQRGEDTESLDPGCYLLSLNFLNADKQTIVAVKQGIVKEAAELNQVR